MLVLLSADMTKIIIAQRVNSVMDSDQIVVLDNGGPYELAPTRKNFSPRAPIYRELYGRRLAVVNRTLMLLLGGVTWLIAQEEHVLKHRTYH